MASPFCFFCLYIKALPVGYWLFMHVNRSNTIYFLYICMSMRVYLNDHCIRFLPSAPTDADIRTDRRTPSEV